MPSSRWSRLYQLQDGILKSEQKFFFLDVNKLDGTFKVFDDENASGTKLQLGWGSDTLSDSTGMYANPELLHVSYPQTITATNVRVVGNDKLNQFPTQLQIKLLDENSVVVWDSGIKTNNSVVYELELEETKSFKSLEIGIIKINTPNATAKLLELDTFTIINKLDSTLVSLESTDSLTNKFDKSQSHTISFTEQDSVKNSFTKTDNILISLSETEDVIAYIYEKDSLGITSSHKTQMTLSDDDALNIYTIEKSNMENIHTVLQRDTRTVYAKVRVRYTDIDIDDSLNLTSSVDVHHGTKLENLYNGYRRSVYPYYFTSEGRSLDGNTHVIDPIGPDVPVAFKSQSIDGGQLVTPVTLTLNFSSRTINSLMMIGDDKLEEYPTDFSITLYDANNLELHTEVVSSNKDVMWTTNVNVDNVVKMVYTIRKINKSNVSLKLQEIYGAVVEEYISDDILNIDILEELSPVSNDVTVGTMSSNQLSLGLLNKNWVFSKGNKLSHLSGLLTRSKEIKVWFGAEVDTKMHWEEMGTFYSNNWNTSRSSLQVTTIAKDLLSQLNKIHNLELMKNVSIFEAFHNIMKDAGLPSSLIIVHEYFRDFTLPFVFFERMTHAECLKQLSGIVPCYIFCDRNNRIRIIPRHTRLSDTSQVVYEPGDIYNYDVSVDRRAVVNTANISTFEYTETLNRVELLTGEDEHTILPGEVLYIEYPFKEQPFSGDIVTEHPTVAGLKVELLTLSTWGMNYRFTNTSNASITFKSIIARGKVLRSSQNTSVFRYRDQISINLYGVYKWDYSHPLIQKENIANELAERVINQYGIHRPIINLDARGDFAVNIGLLVTAEKYDEWDTYAKYRQIGAEHSWDGSYRAKINLEYEEEL